jgi:hypothetical protein
MMKCPQYERLAALLSDGELDGPLRREVRSHVASCAACTRWHASIERIQELLLQEIDSHVDRIDFSKFWEQVERKLHVPTTLSWFERLHLWYERWWTGWPLKVPIGATMVAVLLFAFLFLSRSLKPEPSQTPNNQAQIASLSAVTTVALWNEPTSNATVIWIEDDQGGVVP